tara:strand:- start:2535 stop:2651 length:117 start_codon:yes stop_codon:yes gene_type:complete
LKTERITKAAPNSAFGEAAGALCFLKLLEYGKKFKKVK